MFGIEDRLDAQCPQCANDTVYVEKLVTRPVDERDDYLCRCGKCGWRFRVEADSLKVLEGELHPR